MPLLAIDTSNTLCSVAVYEPDTDTVSASKSLELGRGHADVLMTVVEEVLHDAKCELADMIRIGVTSGPGSFTGVRVGLAAARGLGLALSIPVTGVSVFDVFAHEHNQSENYNMPFVVALDARRDEVFFQTYDGGRTEGPQACGVDEIKKHLPSKPFVMTGSAAAMIQQTHASEVVVSGQTPSPDIAVVARLTASITPDNEKPTALYLRSADAKPQNRFSVARLSGEA